MPAPSKSRKKGKAPSKSLYTPAYDRILVMLRKARLAAGLSQADLAARLGRSQIYVSRCELGERRVDLLEWLEFMHGCQTDPHAFINQVAKLVNLPR